MIRRVALGLIALGTLACAAAYVTLLVTGGSVAWAPWALAFGCAAAPVGLFVLGAVRHDRLPNALRLTFALVFIVLLVSFGYALVMPANEGAGGPLLFGLPRRTAAVFYGVGLIPLVILPVAYAWWFRDAVLHDDDLQRLQAVVAAQQAAVPRER